MAVLTKGHDFSDGEQVTSAKLDAAVDSATFAAGSVDNVSTQLSGGGIIVKDGGVGTSKIADSSVTTPKIADDAITPSKLSAGAPTWNSNQLILNGTDNATLRLISGDNTSFSSIDFGDPQDNNIIRIVGVHQDNSLRLFTDDTERMRINSDGKVVIGNTENISTKVNISNYAIGYGYGIDFYGKSGSSDFRPLNFRNGSGTIVGSVGHTNSATSYNTSSDYRLKEDVIEMGGSLDRLKGLKPCNFRWKSDGTRVDGFLAHEAQEVVPEAVTGTKDAMTTEEYEVVPAVLDEEGNEITPAEMGTREVPDYQGIDQSKLVPLLTKALQEAVAKIESLEARVAALES
jgi:hypothetical protein